MTKGRVLTAVAAAITLIFAIQSSALAQYPPPKGSLFCSTAQVNVQFGATINISATLIDIYGNVMVGETVFFSVAGGGSLSTTSAVTDSSGTATVSVSVNGSTSTVIVFAQNDGLQCQAMIQVLQPPPPPPITIIVQRPPEQQVLTIITPPNTGDAGLAVKTAVGDAPINTYIEVGAGALGLMLAGGVWQMTRRR